MTLKSYANAKINLSLDIVSKMPDDYHNIKTVMQTVSLSDEVGITVEGAAGAGSGRISINSGLPYLPTDERNIAVKAAGAFYRHTGISGYNTSISIEKSIPVCAGLGGGSADGACVLRMLDSMFDTKLGRKTLEAIGGTVGSDVPFCIYGGTVLAEGRGDIMTDLAAMPLCSIVICKPQFNCATPELFRRVRCEKIRARPDTGGIVAALGRGDLTGVARRMYNVFEDVLPRGAREIADIKYTLLDCDALGAVMTGSGPTVFGIFTDESGAERAHRRLKESYAECYLTQTVGKLRVES